MENENKIINVLHDIQVTLNAPKNQFNSFGKYKYRSCEDIKEAVKKILPENYTLLTPQKILLIGDRYYIETIAILRNCTDEITATGLARESEDKKGMDDSQITGTASSYSCKYALGNLLLIDDTKDADTGVDQHQPNKQNKHNKQPQPNDQPQHNNNPKPFEISEQDKQYFSGAATAAKNSGLNYYGDALRNLGLTSATQCGNQQMVNDLKKAISAEMEKSNNNNDFNPTPQE